MTEFDTAVPGVGDQSSIDGYFEATSQYWRDIYRGDDIFSLIHQQRRDIALAWVDQLGLPPGSEVLEVGCGAGLIAVDLARRGLKVHATDTVPAMIELTRRHAAEAGVSDLVDVGPSDVHAFRFEDSVFDLVIALGVIPWLHSPGKAVHEMARVIKPGGTLIANADNAARLNYLFDPKLSPRLAPARMTVKKILTTILRRPSAGRVRSNLHSVDEFDRLLSAARLVKQEGRTFGFGPFTFLGRVVPPVRIGVKLHRWLEGLADQGNAAIASRGAQYIVVARKEPPAGAAGGDSP